MSETTGTEGRGVVGPVLGDCLTVLPLSVALRLGESGREAFYQAVQEDGLLEWGTAWAFAAGGIRQRRGRCAVTTSAPSSSSAGDSGRRR